MPDSQPGTHERMSLAEEWDSLLERVRGIEGFHDFLKPPRLAELLPPAHCTPIVVVNVSQWRCDALIVRHDGVQIEPLPELTAAEVDQRSAEYLQILKGVDEPARRFWLSRQRIDDGDQSADAFREYTEAKLTLHHSQLAVEDMLDRTLAWLWDRIAGPVLTQMGYLRTPGPGETWPRVWWCPTGSLTLLPLHAAGHHGPHDLPAGRSVLDRVISSYTPTLRALREAAEPVPADSSDPDLLIVAVPEPPGEMPLADVARERDFLMSRFPGRHTLLDADGATAHAVHQQLPRHRWAHFSCHGTQNLNEPSQGGLRLWDRTLTIADIAGDRYRGEFAFLSACQTATGGVDLPDEAVTLAAALHYCGYRHVIATLWSVHDATAADVVEAMYTALTTTGEFQPDLAADALHRTLRHLRQQVALSAWTPFTHTGP